MKTQISILIVLGLALVWQAALAPSAVMVLTALTLVALGTAWHDRAFMPPSRGTRTLPLLALALLGYVAMQAANPSHRQVGAGLHLLPLTHVPWLPHAVDRPAALLVLWRFTLYLGLFWLTWRVLPADRHDPLIACLLGVGALLAIAGVVDRPVGHVTRQPMGPFGNENHFAAYLNLLLAPGLALGARATIPARGGGDRPTVLAYVAAAVLAAGVVVSESRTGMVILLLTMLVWAALAWRTRRSAGGLSVGGWVGLLGIGVLGLTLFATSAPVQRQLHTLTGSGFELALGVRGLIWRGSLDMITAHPIVGVGAGGFAAAFPYFQPVALEGVCSSAHSDGLQAVAELGFAGGALLAALLLRWGVAARRAWATRDPLARACLVALGGLALHACVDAPLQVPAVVLLAVVLAGIVARRADGVAPSAATC